MDKIQKIIFFFILIANYLLFSQEKHDIFPVLTVAQGLSQNSILQIEQDEKGFLWLANQAGLSRWDGKNVINFPRNNQDIIPPGYLQHIVKDKRGWLWIIASDNVLYFWNTEQFGTSLLDTSDLNSPVNYLLNDNSQDYLLIITKAGVIWSWDKNKSILTRKIQNPELLVNCHIWLKENLWLGTENGWYVLNAEGGLQKVDDISVYDCLEYDGMILASRGEKGISSLNPNTHKNTWISKKKSHTLNHFASDRIISSSRNGLFFELKDYRDNWLELTLRGNNFPVVNKSYTLESGQVVYGSPSEGLFMFDPYLPYLENWTPDQSVSDQKHISYISDIMAFTEPEENILWMAVYNGGIIRYNRTNNSIRGYQESLDNIPTNNIKHIMSDSEGRIWVSTFDQGFLIYHEGSDRFIKPEIQKEFIDFFKGLRINHISQKDKNTLMISTISGLFEYDIDRMELLSLDQIYGKELSEQIWTTYTDEDNTLWIGTDRGIYSLKKSNRLIHHKSKYNRIWFITQNSEREIMTGSPSGVEFFNTYGEPIRTDELDRVINYRSVYGVEQDVTGRYWITTNKGVIYWDREDRRFDELTIEEGLLSNEMNLYSLGLLKNGYVFMGSIKGISLVNPLNILPNLAPPSIGITQIEVMNLSRENNEIRERGNIQTNEEKQPVILEPNDKVLTIHFTPVAFHGSDTVQTRYILEGFSSEWIDITGQDRINFVNLPPGNYKLSLMAYQYSTDFSHTVTQEIVVKPSFVQTSLFYQIVILAIILILILVIYHIIKLRKEIGDKIKAEKKTAQINHTLEELQSYMKDIIDSMPSQLIGIDGMGRIILWNNKAASENSLSLEEVKSSELRDILPDMQAYWDKIILSMERNEITFIDKDSYKKQEDIKFRAITIFPLTSTQRKGAVIRIDDVTEQVTMEQQLIHREKLSSLGTLAAGIAHDMNNLLTPILGYTDLLLANLDKDEENKTILNQIISAGEKARDMIKQLLNYSKENREQYKIITLHDIVNNMEFLLKKSLNEKVTLILASEAKDCFINANVGQIENILLNLTVNAEHAMLSGGTLTIDWKTIYVDERFCLKNPQARVGEFVCLSVKDTGTGMSQETIEKIFAPFYSTKGERGTGLGLTTVSSTMKSHSGFISVKSKLGKGTDFKLFFPCVKG